MKKLFNYALLAAALLVGVNVNAQTPVCELTMNGSTKQLTSLYEAFDEVTTAALDKSRGIAPEAYIDHETDFYEAVDLADSTVATIKLLANATLDAGRYAHIDGFKYVLNAGERITIDLNGKTLTSNVRFNIFEASLYFVNTNAQVATINTDNNKVSQFLNAYGSRDKDAAYGFCRIVLGKNIVFNNPEGYGMCFFPNDYYFSKFNGTPYKAKNGPGAGTTIDIYGEIRCDSYGISGNGYLTVKEGNIPIITLHEGAKLITTDGPCIYAPAYAIYNIHGYVEGASGIYIKAGEFNIDGATVVATSTTHTDVEANGNGTTGGDGTAIVIDSHSGYGNIGEINIANSTVISNASNGYAIEELVTEGGEKLPDIIVTSGTFVGGITTTDEERQHIVETGSVQGGEWHNSDINQYLDDKHTTIVYTDKDGKKYQVVVPIGSGDWSRSIAEAAGKKEGLKYAKVAANEDVNTDTKVEFVRIQDDAVVTVKAGKTLDAGTLMTEGNSQIVVEAGATLIVSGEQGAYTFDENSLLVETSEANPGLLLINPAVVLNTTPKSTVKFISKSYRNSADDKQFQYFGTPMVGKITSMTWDDARYQTQLDVWNGSDWDRIGVSDNTGESFDYDKFNKGFGFYAILSNNPDNVTLTYTIQGNLAGNTNAEIALPTDWNAISNAYMGKINKMAMLNFLKTQKENGLAGSVYEYSDQGDVLLWTAYNGVRVGKDIDPMQPIMLFNGSGKAQNVDFNYADLVYNPVMGGNPAPAPRYNEIMKATIRVKGCGMRDLVTIAEDGQFSSDFEDEFDAKKFDNKTIKFYVNADDEYDIYATDNIENTFVGLNTTKAGKYTISFEDVTGNFDLVDLKTNARIAMAEGNTYEFLAEAGEDAYRFMVVEGAKAPTEMQKTNAAVKATKALINDQIVISNGERFFNVLGAEVK